MMAGEVNIQRDPEYAGRRSGPPSGLTLNRRTTGGHRILDQSCPGRKRGPCRRAAGAQTQTIKTLPALVTRWISPGLSGAAMLNRELFFCTTLSGALNELGSSVCVKIL